jgi:GNAT superfamily N-acetyltransferase
MKAREFVVESAKTASAEQVWNYVDGIHPDDQKGGGFLKSLIMRYPQYELRRIPLSSIHIPDQEYDDEEQDPEQDPYNRVQTVDPEHAGEYSANFVDRRPIVVDSEGWIIDGNHRAWAASELLNKKDIMAYVPVLQLKEGQSVKREIKDFIDSLTPADVGVEEFSGYRIHFEGFTDECKSSSDYQKNPNKVYKQVYQDFIDREGGRKPVKSSMVGDEEYPILYSVFKVPQSKTVDTAEKAYSIAYKKKQPWPRGSREEKLIRSNWQLSSLYDQYILKQDVNEISDKRLQSYLSRAGKQVDSRLDRMSQARERLNKGYEIYHADRPAGGTQIVDRFEADTPALAQRYYERYIRDYNSDVDFDLRLRRSTGIMEIARIPQGDFGDKDTLEPMATMPKTKPLPGGSRFSYAVNQKNPEFMEIMIFDNRQLVAELDLFATLDPLNTWGIETVATDPDYRGQGLGKALYGIALNILKLTLEAGATQTKHGQAMWIMLNSIPGVEVLGYAMEPTEDYRQKRGDQIVDQNATWTRYTFPVEPGSRSMRSTRRGTGIYSSNRVSMIAKWTGR